MSGKAVPLMIGALAAAMIGLVVASQFFPEASPKESRILRVCVDRATTTPSLWLSGGEYVGEFRPRDFGLSDLTAFRMESADELHWSTPWALAAADVATSTVRLTVTPPGATILAANGPVHPVLLVGEADAQRVRLAVGVWIDESTAAPLGDGRCPIVANP